MLVICRPADSFVLAIIATDGGEGVQFREREGGNETMTMMVMAKMADDDRLQIAETERGERQTADRKRIGRYRGVCIGQ